MALLSTIGKLVGFSADTYRKIKERSILERFDDEVGTRIAPIVRSIRKGDLRQVGREIQTNFKLSNERLKDPKAQVETAVNFTPMGIGRVAKVAKPTLARTATNIFKPVETRIKQLGEAGTKLKDTISRGIDLGEVSAGKRISSLQDLRVDKLSKADRFNLLDALEGRAVPNQKVASVFQRIRNLTDEVGNEAQDIGVKIKRKTTLDPKSPDFKTPTGLTPFQREELLKGNKVFATLKDSFKKRENFFPHIIPNADELSKGVIRKDIVDNLVRLKVRPDVKTASQFVDDYIDFIQSGKRKDSILQHMVDTGQAQSADEALMQLQRFRNRTIKRQGSLENAREVDLPFYDPDPARVLPKYLNTTSQRLSQIKEFGQDNEVINKLINQIRKNADDPNNEANADFARTAVDRILDILNNKQTDEKKLSSFVRTLNGFKLGLASIPNLSQGGLNTLLAADTRAVVAGLVGAARHSGRSFATRSGATLESVLRETINETAGSSKVLGKFLKATGFSATEKINRTIAANGAKSYAPRLLKRLIKNPKDTRASDFLREMGVDIGKAVKRGALTDDELLLVAKKFTDMTQFRSRPQDLPLFASTEAGKVFFQFKNFIYGQTRLVYRETVGELKAKRFGRATRNLLILSSVFPIAGEVVADIRSVITGREREEKGLQRYFDNLAQVGAMGILLDTLRSGGYGKGVDALVGPTISDAGAVINALGGDNKAKNLTKFITRRIPLVGQVVPNRIKDDEKTKKKSPRAGNPFNLK